MLFSLNGKITEEQQKRDLETSIAKLLVSDYEGVKTIKFTGWGHSRETGSWGTTVVINGENEMGFSFDGLSSLEEISSIVSDENIQLTESENAIENPRIRDRISRIQKTSLKGIDIIYSEDDKEK
ncbi:membrane protein [Streptococcus equi subsp. zooepidemicus SzAM35]|nr:membrane protein [Streptococcus equi subsp. zooepidemicus SzAM35]